MRWLLLLALIGNAYADVFRLHDGDGAGNRNQEAVTWTYYNHAAHLKWYNAGGDWVDVEGTAQGIVPQSAASGAWTVGQDIEIDVTPLIQADGLYIRRGGPKSITFASRETATPPLLIVTHADGSITELPPSADSTLTRSTAYGQGKVATLKAWEGFVMQFPLVNAAVSAKLRLRVVAADSGTKSLEVFAMKAPRTPPGEHGIGYSSLWPGDIGIAEDPLTIYAESWDDPANWWAKDGLDNTTPTTETAWPSDGAFRRMWRGMWLANGGADVPAQCTGVLVPRGTGFYGDGLMGVHCTDKLAVGVEVPTASLTGLTGGEMEEAWARYYIKYGANHTNFAKCEGGKAPGFAGNTKYAGNSGAPGWGLRGWSMRHQFQLVCDTENPAYGRIVFAIYAYHGDIHSALFGDFWGAAEHGLLETERWYCIEQHVKVNTPGLNDGIVETFIDGRKVISKQDVLMRSVKPDQGYGGWQKITSTSPAPAGAAIYTDHHGYSYWLKGGTIESDLGIDRFWGMVHNGGTTPTGVNGQFWYDQTVISTQRVGCMIN